MLSIMDPVDIDNLVVYRDDEDPRKFYLLPDEPVISTDAAGQPDFYFIIYRALEAGHKEGGYVQFRVMLSISPERRARVVAALKDLLTQDQAAGRKPFGLDIKSTDPILADPLWTKGTVSLLTMQAAPDGLVTVASDQPLPCDLAGALGASGRIGLSPDGAAIFWAAFNDYKVHKLPILITYQLTYAARAPSTMSIDADGTTVIDQFWERANPRPHIFWLPLQRYVAVPFDGPYNRAAHAQLRLTMPAVEAMVEPGEITKAIRSSVTDKTINVVIDTNTIGGPDGNKVQDTLFKLATDLLVNDVVPAIFGTGPGSAPPQPLPASDSKDDPAATKQLFKLPSKDTTETHFHIRMTANQIIERNVNPTGALQLLISDPNVLASCFKEIQLGHDFFTKKHVTICTAGLDFATDGISQIAVSGRYTQVDEKNHQAPAGALHPDALLKSAADTGHWDFPLALDPQGVPKDQFEYTTKVYYNNLVLATDWQPWQSDYLTVNPAAMGAVRVGLALTARRDEVRSVSVALSYRKASGEVLSDVVILTPDEGRKTWIKHTGELRPPDPNAPAPVYTYQLTYQTTAAGQLELAPQTSSADTLEVPTPFPRTLSFTFTPQGSFDNVAAIAGEVTYEDPAHGYKVVKPFSLEKLSSSFSMDVPILDGGPEEVSWEARIVHPDGSQTPLPPARGGIGNHQVGPIQYPPLKVTVMPDLLDFNADLQLAAVRLTYHDPVSGDATQELKFNKANSSQEQVWRIPQEAQNLPQKVDVDIRFFAIDRTKSAEFHLKDLGVGQLYLDRKAGVSTI